jgi:spore coat polysaccharide biosynthesis protein SpsF
MLARQIERVRRSRLVDHFLVATSLDGSDDRLEQLCRTIDIPCFRGSLADVLDRFYRAASQYAAADIVRLTGDCPLADPELIDQVIAFYREGGYDYVSNAVEPTFPDGLDVEVFRYECLEQTWREALLPSEREHVTTFIYSHPERFRIGQVRAENDHSSLRWTVDVAQDFRLVSEIYAALYPANPNFSTADIFALLDSRPELKIQNTRHARNEGLEKSRREDQTFVQSCREKHVKPLS